jgi:hypothetical protein
MVHASLTAPELARGELQGGVPQGRTDNPWTHLDQAMCVRIAARPPGPPGAALRLCEHHVACCAPLPYVPLSGSTSPQGRCCSQ